VHEELVAHGVDVYTNTTAKAVVKGDAGLIVHAERLGETVSHTADTPLIRTFVKSWLCACGI
jgi:hypothetical protein